MPLIASQSRKLQAVSSRLIGTTHTGMDILESDTRNELPSLLWPPGHQRDTRSQGLSDQQSLDLGLDVLVRELDWGNLHARHVRTVLLGLVADPVVIAYRQAIVAELRTDPQLRAAITALLPSLAELAQPRSAIWAQESPLLLVPPRLSDLELYVGCVQDLHAALAAAERHASGLRALQAYLHTTRAAEQFQTLVAELPGLRAQLDQVASVTVGVNLDRDLRPLSATLVALNREPFTGPRSITQRLFGRSTPPGLSAMTALRHVAERSPETDPLARDLAKVLAEVVQPVAAGLERYQRLHARPLAALAPELAFFLAAVELAERFTQQGLPTCLPAISNDAHNLNEAYNPALALQLANARQSNGAHSSLAIVRNPVDFDRGRIVLLTGPNRGGKTTYIRTVGLNQVLFQAGVYVAAADGQMTPVDAILTHFPPVESVEPGGGRLDQEARRLREMFAAATTHSLLLFNEPLTSTSEREAHGLASDVLRALGLLGARAVFVTHLHSLAADLALLNNGAHRAHIVSWVAGVGDDAARTYNIRPGQPATFSHAMTIAQQHGITFAQLAQQLAERGVIELPRPEAPPSSLH